MALSRRQAVLGLGLTGVAVSMNAVGNASTSRNSGGKAPLSQRLGIEKYVLRDVPVSNLIEVLNQLFVMGYREIEGPIESLSVQGFRNVLDKTGFVCPSMTTGFDPSSGEIPSLSDPEGLIAYARSIGVRNVVVSAYPVSELVPYIPSNKNEVLAALKRQEKSDYKLLGQLLPLAVKALPLERWMEFANRLNRAGAILADAGLRLSYHNHGYEMIDLPDGRNAYDLLMSETDEAVVDFELDIGWAAAAGFDPAHLLRKYGRRITQVHLKDFGATATARESGLHGVDVGQGIMDWGAVADALGTSAVQHIYFEQEPPYPISPLDSAKVAHDYIVPILAARGL